MKTINNTIKYILLVWVMVACAEEEIVTLRSNPDAPVLLSPTSGGSLNLDPDRADEMVQFEFSPADFGFQAAVTYTIQMSFGGDFEEVTDVVSSTGSPASISVGALNERLIQKGLSPDDTENLVFRVKASINPNVDIKFSEAVPLQVTAFAVELDFPRLYLPGDHQGWDPANENTVIYSVDADGVYEGFVHILGGSGEFKVNETPSWDINYGDNGPNGILDLDGANLNIDGQFGTFRLRVDMTDKSYEMGTRRIWGLVGDATPGGWDTDTPLEFDSQENVLTLTLDLNSGEMKFRADNDWGFNYGDNDLNGVLDDGGDNILIPESGNYTVIMDWRTPGEISYSIERN